MIVIVAGAGRLGGDLAAALARAGNDVTRIVHDASAPPAAEPGRVRLLSADPLEPATLEAAGALRADVLVACSAADEDNLAVAAVAKRRFEVPRVVALLNDPDHAWLFDATWGIDATVSASATLLALVAEATGAPGPVSLDLVAAGVNLRESTVAAGSPAAGATLAELGLPAGVVVAAVVREGRTFVPAGSFRLAEGDRVLAVTETGGAEALDAVFGPAGGRP